MTDNKILSIIIPMYNVEKYVSKAIKSIENDSDHIEIIIVNDGSTDKSLEVVSKLIDEQKNIRILNKKNEGVGLARNSGYYESVGEYVYFMDPDDYLEPGFVQNVIVKIKNINPNVILFGVRSVDENGNTINIKVPEKQLFIKENYEVAMKYDYLEKQSFIFSPWNKIYKKSFLKEHSLKFTSQRVGQDALFNIEMLKVATKVYVDNEIYYNYLITRKNSAQNAINTSKIYDELNIFFEYKKMFKFWNIDGKKNYSGYAVYLFKNNLSNINHKNKYDKKELNDIRARMGKLNFKADIMIFVIINFPHILKYFQRLIRRLKGGERN